MLGAYSSTSLPPYIRHYICWSSMSQHICHKNISSSLYFGSLLINIIATTLYTSQHMLWSSMPPYICHIYSWLYFGSLLVNIVATLYMSQHVFIVVFREPTRQHRCHPIYVTTCIHCCISGAYSSTSLPPYIRHYICWSSMPPYLCHNICPSLYFGSLLVNIVATLHMSLCMLVIVATLYMSQHMLMNRPPKYKPRAMRIPSIGELWGCYGQ